MDRIADEKFKEFLKHYYEDADAAVIIYDTALDKYTYCNKKIEDIFEMNREKFLSMSRLARIYSFVHVDDIYRLLRFQMTDDTGDSIYRIVGNRTGKIKWIHTRFFRKKIMHKTCVYIIVEDISDTMAGKNAKITRKTVHSINN